MRIKNLGHYLFFLAVFTIPWKKEYQIIIRSIAKRLCSEKFPFKEFVAGNIGYTISDLIVLMMLGLWVYCIGKSRQIPFPRRGAAVLAGVIFVALCSIFFSSYRTLFTSYYKLLQLTIALLFTLMLCHGFPHKDPKKLISALFKAAAASGTMQAVIALLQYFRQKEIGLRFLGETKFTKEGFEAAIFNMPGGKLCALDVSSFTSQAEKIYRAYGTLGSPNILGGFLSFTILATLTLLAMGRQKQLIVKLALWLQIFGLVITYCRSAFFALVCSASIFFLAEAFRKKRIGFFFSLKVPVLHFCCSSLVAILFFLPQLLQRGGFFNYSNTLAESADMGRIAYQDAAIALIKKIPLLGIGFNNYNIHMKHQVHNAFLLVAAEIGLLGLILILLPLFFLFYRLCKTLSALEGSALIAIFGCFGFIAMCDFYLITSSCGKMLLFTFLGTVGLWIDAQKKTQLNSTYP